MTITAVTPLVTGGDDVSVVVAELRLILGAKLVAYLAQLNETQTVQKWVDGVCRPSAEIEIRLRAASQALRLISDVDGDSIVPTWFQGMNPHLRDRAPARVLREENDSDQAAQLVVTAAQAFVSA